MLDELVDLSPEERIRSRLVALENAPARWGPGAYNVVATMRAGLSSVTIAGDLVTIDYLAPGGDRGVDGSTSLRAFVQQLVLTASEEPGIVRVMITQNGEAGGSSAAPRRIAPGPTQGLFWSDQWDLRPLRK